MSWSLLMVMVPLTIYSLKMGTEEQPTEHREFVFWLYQGSYFSFIEVFHGLVIPWQIDLQKVTKSSESPKGNPVDKDVQTCENCVQLRQNRSKLMIVARFSVQKHYKFYKKLHKNLKKKTHYKFVYPKLISLETISHLCQLITPTL